MKRIVLTGGGSAGHVTPHLALLPHLLKAGYEVHYIGTENGIEHGMIAQLDGVTYHAVKSGKLRRYFDWKNFTDPFRVIAGAFQSAHLMRKLKPDVCFSKGGFVFTGTPLRPELFSGSREKGLQMAHFTADKPVLLMMGGSLGAQSVNEALRAALPRLLPVMQVFHLCGKGNIDESLNGLAGYYQVEFLSKELPDAMAAADLILSRAGANALCEFQALGKPMLLIPYPKGASRGDQILNAASYEKRGLARVMAQENMTSDSLADALLDLLKNGGSLRQALRDAPPADGTQAVLKLIEEVQKK